MKATYATEIVRLLHRKGHQAYFVGGCVRDMVMGLEPSDYDIATGARPEEIVDMFPRTEPIGVQFGVVLVIHGGHPYEVATFRSDEAYVDGRRPSGVVFTGPEEDVLRRDFTINGLLYDPIEDRVIDYVDGQSDIRDRIVRAIGNPLERFEEDKLRILRAIRFGARFGYSVEADTWRAVCAMAPKIRQVSAERIRDELLKILTEGQAAHGFRMLKDSGLLVEVLPEVRWNTHLEECLLRMRPPLANDFALGVLLHECRPDVAQDVASRLRLSNAEIAHVRALVEGQAEFSNVSTMAVSSLKRLLRKERFEDHLVLYRIHTSAAGLPLDTFEVVQSHLDEWSEADLSPPPLLSGTDLISLGLEPGPSFTRILTAIENAQLEGRLQDREGAIAFVREHFL